ncbi:MAG: MBL fold metallo-hydrolase [Nitrospirae bacterium]|nr:MBL fold metallo-hydrolase [Nitrospirota bacterium]MBF0542391.1 MBL fold metallo-hydrolase [Nitrospirota bacterium]
MLENIKWLEHDTFRIAGKKLIYLDPFKIKNPEAADIIFCSHSHHDHCSPEDIAKLIGKNTIIVAPEDCLKTLKINSLKTVKEIKTIKPGDTIEIDGIIVRAVPAYNTNKQFHPKTNQWVGYIITIDDNTIYFAGDTDYIPEMKGFKGIDIAMLPVSGTYVMTAEEAANAAIDISPKIAIPMHYGSLVGTKADAERFATLLKGKIPVKIL